LLLLLPLLLLLQAASDRQQYFTSQELANLLYALPALEAQPSRKWLSGFLNACYDSLPEFNSQELSLLGLGLVRLHHRPRQEWRSAYMQAVRVQLDATGSTVSACGSSSSSSGVPDHFGMSGSSSNSDADGQDQPAAAAASRADGFQVQGFVNVLRVLCAWGEQPTHAWRGSCRAAAGRLLPQLSAEGSSTLVWAMVKLRILPGRDLLVRLLAHTQPQLQAATATDLALLAWGLGTLGVTPISGSSSSVQKLLVPWLDEFMYYSHRALGSATARSMACLLVGVVRMCLQPGE
jgi:hypothetical protein